MGHMPAASLQKGVGPGVKVKLAIPLVSLPVALYYWGYIPPPPHLSHGLLALTHDGSRARQKPKRRFLPTTQKLQDRPGRSIE